MMACKWCRKLRTARHCLEEVRIFLEEDLHIVTLEEDAAMVWEGEEDIARGARVCSRL